MFAYTYCTVADRITYPMEIDMTKYSANQIRSINQALNETRDALAREMAYRSDLRNIEMIDFYTHHIAKLEAMLAD